MTRRERTEFAALAVGLLAGVWRWRLELALLALALGLERLLAGPLGDAAATGVVATLAVAGVLAGPSRRFLSAALRRRGCDGHGNGRRAMRAWRTGRCARHEC